MEIKRYNTRVREAMSNEYIKCSRRINELKRRICEIENRLKIESETLLHIDYLDLHREKDCLLRKLDEECIMLEVWDKAREICMNIADEEEREENEKLDVATDAILDMFGGMFPGL